jgi:hypothetical protein
MEQYIKHLLEKNNIPASKLTDKVIQKLTESVKVEEIYKTILSHNQEIMNIFNQYKESEEFKEYHLVIPNAKANEDYSFKFDISNFPNIKIKEIRNIENLGLSFDNETLTLSGKPVLSTQEKFEIVFYNEKNENQTEEIKVVHFVVNADPRTLFISNPVSKDIKFWKEEDAEYAGEFLDKKIVIASKRGRSHAHEGTTRDDHFSTKKLFDNWEIVAVADGAGSAKFAREGSRRASEQICEKFNNEETLSDLNTLISEFYTEDKQEIEVKQKIFNILYKKVLSLHNDLISFAEQENILLKDLNTTLIFALMKKFEFGYIILTFGVGDCPICILNEDISEVKLLNKLDIGEFSGGTRFITMPEILTNDGSFPLSQRFGIHKYENFSKLFLMTDGIYDPKFDVEKKLEDLEAWQRFLADLDGENEDKVKVDFTDENKAKEDLLKWMDFWSKGNHDDRTLAIIY